MKHLNFTITPIERLNYFSAKWNSNVYVKRDDLFLEALGGNKARMLQYILYPIVDAGVKVVLSAGGPMSNFNRALALMCAKLGIKLKLVSYTDNKSEYNYSMNFILSKLCGADLIFCEKNEVVQTIERVKKELELSNMEYEYIYGGGKSLEGVYSYYDAVKELKQQSNVKFDEVYVACGTGTTIAGICAGFQEYSPLTKIYGISVARNWKLAKNIIKEDIEYINGYLGKSYDLSNLIFKEDFLLGGYGKSSEEELQVIKEVISREGMIVDSCYSGKAFYGMFKLQNLNSKGKNILFWNTGGLINLLSDYGKNIL